MSSLNSNLLGVQRFFSPFFCLFFTSNYNFTFSLYVNICLLAQYSYITAFDHIHQEIAADEDNVRKVSQYLTDVVLPKFIQDLCTLEVSPMDGQTLTEALHAHGINVRYIGRVSTVYFGQLKYCCNYSFRC